MSAECLMSIKGEAANVLTPPAASKRRHSASTLLLPGILFSSGEMSISGLAEIRVKIGHSA